MVCLQKWRDNYELSLNIIDLESCKAKEIYQYQPKEIMISLIMCYDLMVPTHTKLHDY